MGRQRNMSYMKEQDKSPEKEPNEMEASNLPDIDFFNGYKDVQIT